MKIADIIANLHSPEMSPIRAPTYTGDSGRALGLAVKDMANHTSDEGEEIFRGLAIHGYKLYGRGYINNDTDIGVILDRERPGVVLLQDKREWDLSPRDFRDPLSRFTNCYRLGCDSTVFKLTILKDAHQRPEYHRRFMEDIGCHAVVCYYHPDIVAHLAPYVRREHLIRTYHTVDPAKVPDFMRGCRRKGALLSGAISNAYPIRSFYRRRLQQLPLTEYLPHPGYHRRGCETGKYLQTLNQYRIAICTCSVYGYALRKIVEATAVGCVVITNLPDDEKLPYIDGNLIRLRNPGDLNEIGEKIRIAYAHYDEERQRHFAQLARVEYAYQIVCHRLAHDIGAMRANYNAHDTSGGVLRPGELREVPQREGTGGGGG